MIQKDNNINLSDKKKDIHQKNNPAGYPLYPPKEDIYNQGEEKLEISQEDLSDDNVFIENPDARNENDLIDKSQNDLDIPGSELDDQLEDSGSEDEENNYYSIGGDEHNELEEDKG